MRKINPEDVKSDFADSIRQTRSLFQKLESLTQHVSMAERSHVAEQALMSGAVLWEGFISDLFVAYLNRDSAKLSKFFEARVSASLRDKFGQELADNATVTLSLPKHLRKTQIALILDPHARNITFKDAATLVARANDQLGQAVATKFSALTPAERAAIDAWREVRNFLAHRSQSAADEMNTALGAQHLPAGLRRGAKSVAAIGAFLKAWPKAAGPARVVQYLDAMTTIAAKL